MINPKELRLGNLVKDRGGKTIRIDFFENLEDKHSCKFGQHNEISDDWGPLHPLTEYTDFAEPIIITKEELIKLGFVSSPAANSTYKSIPELKAEIHFEDFRGGLVCVLYCSTGSFIPNDIKYVHQLQNFCHSITNAEILNVRQGNDMQCGVGKNNI